MEDTPIMKAIELADEAHEKHDRMKSEGGMPFVTYLTTLSNVYALITIAETLEDIKRHEEGKL